MHGELRGILPSTEWKRAAYRRKEQQKWYAGETISLGIGQGYNAFTMLQLAQAQATVAAGGQRFKPHLVRAVENVETRQQRKLSGEALPPVPLNPEHVAIIHRAYHGVTLEGTSARSFANAPYKSGGKTGTAQVVQIKANEKYDASKVDERHRDHALYTAFAPLDAPQIALALIVENAGFGAGAAAPIARRVFDYVLTGVYPSEDDILATQQGKSTVPTGKPRPADTVPLPGVPAPMMPAASAIPMAASAPVMLPKLLPVAASAPLQAEEAR
jgi:penicillin-binding protein 2